MTRSVRAARQAVADRLAGVTDPCSLWEMSCVADAAARKVGRRTELYPSLYEYADLLPGGWRTQWLAAKGGSGDSMLMVVPENWMPRQARSRSLLLGSGVLEPVSHSIDWWRNRCGKEANVSRAYEMTVEIKDYKARNLPKIIRACCEEWDFEADDFTRQRTDPLKRRYDSVTATAQGNLCGGEQEQEFAQRLTLTIWKANGGFCPVEVRSVYLEELPYETYMYDEDDFKAMTRRT